MSDLNLQLVREFFELNLFRALTPWNPETGRGPGVDSGVQLLVENAQPLVPLEPPDTILRASEIRYVERAVVEIRAWHGEPFYPSVIESSPVLFHFALGENLAAAREHFGAEPFATLLVISELPASSEQRRRSTELFEASPVDHVIEFPSILRSLFDRISVHSPYSGSNTLQLLRILKRYRFIRRQQMEFPFKGEERVEPRIETPATNPDNA